MQLNEKNSFLKPIQLFVVNTNRPCMVHICTCIYTCRCKSDDPQSPAYIPTIFSFTSSPLKRKANRDLLRYQAIKRREQNKAMREEPNMVTDYISEGSVSISTVG